jgi:hypothetical protein
MSSKFESLSFASSRECVDPEIGVRHVRRVERSGKTFYTPKYLNQERNSKVFVEM